MKKIEQFQWPAGALSSTPMYSGGPRIQLWNSRNTNYLFFSFFLILFYLTLQYCIGFAIYQNESATGEYVNILTCHLQFYFFLCNLDSFHLFFFSDFCSSDFFFIETRKTLSGPSNPEKEQSWRNHALSLQTILKSYNNQSSMVLA